MFKCSGYASAEIASLGPTTMGKEVEPVEDVVETDRLIRVRVTQKHFELRTDSAEVMVFSRVVSSLDFYSIVGTAGMWLGPETSTSETPTTGTETGRCAEGVEV